ncbi:hypothetical protein JCM16358_11590 [Halanaerocella petrolearia]
MKIKIISEKQIKEILVDKQVDYKKDKEDYLENRELIRRVFHDNHGKVGSIHYSLTGSPPRGYVTAIRDSRWKVIFYDSEGREFKRLEGTKVKEVEKMLKDD